ncbi:MAG: GNAT family N-acetyltransferase [Tepidiformaceae bacterium]
MPALDHLVLTSGPRTRIRAKDERDAIDDFQWRRDAETNRLDGSGPINLAYSEFLEQFRRENAFVNPARRQFSIESLEALHIGNVMYYNVDGAREEAEFGITIGRQEYRGAGFGREVTVAFLRFLWETLPFRRVVLHTLESNERARQCFQRAGFADTARVFRNGQWFVRMEARREWWLLWDMEGRFLFPAERSSAPLAKT